MNEARGSSIAFPLVVRAGHLREVRSWDWLLVMSQPARIWLNYLTFKRRKKEINCGAQDVSCL
jgi:hypothetical protein